MESAEGTTYAWGRNKEGELSQGNSGNVLTPTTIKRLKNKNLIMVASGGQHSAAIDVYGKLYVCGCYLHGKLGIEGLSTVTVPAFTAIKALDSKVVRQVACGDYHTLCLTDDNSVYTWGGTLHKKLGQRGGANTLNKPGEVAQLRGKNIVYVDCGDFHSVALAANGEVYTWGGGGSFYNRGQCGHGHLNDVESPSVVPFFRGMNVAQVSCGGYHTLALTEDNQLYAWGSGLYGECGFGEFINVSSPRQVLMPWVKRPSEDAFGRIADISAGGHHSLVLTDGGFVFSFGYGSHGQLGLRSTTNFAEPQFVKDLRSKPVKMIAAGWNHSLVLTQRGDLYSCGYGFFGQLGHASTESKTMFTHVEALGPKQVERIFAGGNHSWALLDPAEPLRRDYSPPSPIPTEISSPARSPTPLRFDSPEKANKLADSGVDFPEYVLQIAYSDVQFCHRFVRFTLKQRNLDMAKNRAEEFVQEMYTNEQGLQYHRIQEDDDIVEEVEGRAEVVSAGGGLRFTCLLVCDPSRNEPPTPRSEFSDELSQTTVVLKPEELLSNPVQAALSEWVRFFLKTVGDFCAQPPKFFELRPMAYYMPI